MMAWDLIFAEEVFHNILSTLAIIENAVSLEESADALRGKMGIGDLLLRQLLDTLHYLLVTHLQDNQLSGNKPSFDHLLSSLFRLLSLNNWDSHKDFSCILISSRESVENVASIETVILGESPLIALIEKFVTQAYVNGIRIEWRQWLT